MEIVPGQDVSQIHEVSFTQMKYLNCDNAQMLCGVKNTALQK